MRGAYSAAICSVLGFHLRSILVVATDYRTEREPGFGLSFELRVWVLGLKFWFSFRSLLGSDA